MEQGRLKYRIIGAAVLVALLALLVPALLDWRERPPEGPQQITLPQEPQEGLAGAIRPDDPRPPPQLPELEDIPLPSPPPATDLAPPSGAPAAPPPAASVAPPATAPPAVAPPPSAAPPAAPAPPPPAATAPPPAPPPAAPSGSVERVGVEAWIVQVGTFTNREGAEKVRAQLKTAGYKVFTEETVTGGQTAVRVRVGPELDRAQAEQTRERIAREQGLEGVVLRYH